jgi:hypothetical protein
MAGRHQKTSVWQIMMILTGWGQDCLLCHGTLMTNQ